MNVLKRIWLIPLLLLLAWTATAARAANQTWTPTPPRLSYLDGDVSYWRPGAEDWARAQPNLALAEGDALYTGADSNLEVQFGRRSFVRADETTELQLVAQAEHRIQFKLTAGLASFDLRSMDVGDTLEVSTPNAAFLIEHPGYYRVEVGSRDTHFITRRGGEATLTTADGRTLAVYPSEDIVISAGDPVQVATYAAPAPDAWDRWNDERSDRLGESVSARYLSPDVYGAEDLDYYGHWRVVPTYGAVWIPYGVSVGWVPYSTGYWVWDPYYEWTWVDEAPWGWAPFHYGRWVYIDGYWAWAPGPVLRRPVYSPALVAFLIQGHDVSVRLSVGLPGIWWVALSWGEPVIPWWGPPRHRGHPWWGGWGGPRIVNNVVIKQTTIVNVGDIHFHNATLPHAVLTVPADRFGRERVRATVEERYRPNAFAPVRGELPVKPGRVSLYGGAPKGMQPPRDTITRPVVSTRKPRERAQPLKDAVPRAQQGIPESRYVVPPVRREDRRALPQRPPFGAEAGPERTPPPPPPRYEAQRRSVSQPAAVQRPPREPAAVREPAPGREQPAERREARPAAPPISARERETVRERPTEQRAAPPAPPAVAPREREPVRQPEPGRGQAVERGEARPSQPPVTAREQETVRGRETVREQARGRPLPGQPASQIYRGRDRDTRGQR